MEPADVVRLRLDFDGFVVNIEELETRSPFVSWLTPPPPDGWIVRCFGEFPDAEKEEETELEDLVVPALERQ